MKSATRKAVWVVFSMVLWIGALRAEEPSVDKQEQAAGDLEEAAENKANSLHRLDSLSFLVYTLLLVIAVLTVWLFKHHRFRFMHESGLTLVYGLLVGMALRFSKVGSGETFTADVLAVNESILPRNEPPDYVVLAINDTSGKSVQFLYSLLDRTDSDRKGQLFQEQTTFSPEIFFNILLPPIIFNAGYSLKKKHFFRNIGSIMMFAFLGTTLSCCIVGLLMYVVCKTVCTVSFSLQEMLFFGALISATDPVTVLAIFSDMGVESDLFALVFGESVLNDAVAIILAGTIDRYIPSAQSENLTFDIPALVSAIIRFFTILLGSFTLGAVVGCSSALLTKFTKIADYPLLETSLFLLLSYVSFLLAEYVQMTGIVAVLFCGICQAHYTYNNLSEESQSRTKQFFEVVNFLSESFIFSYIGVSMFVSHSLKWDFAFVIAALVVIVIARAGHIYPLSLLLNIKRRPKIPSNHQHMMLFAGLRGAIAFALAIRNTSTPQRQIIYTATSVVVIVTVIFNGGLTAWMIDKLRIRHGTDGAHEIQPQFQLVRDTDGEDTRTASEPEQIQSGLNPWDKSFLPRKWYNFDANFMKPLLTHATPTLMDTMPAFCLPLARLLTTTEQMTLSAGRSQRSSTTQDVDGLDSFGQTMENPLSRESSFGDMAMKGDLGSSNSMNSEL